MPDQPAGVTAARRRAGEHGFAYSCDPVVGRLLATLAAAVPLDGRVLELGTGFGVGTAWLFHGLAGRDDVRLVTVDRVLSWRPPFEVRVGDAEALLPGLGTFDLIFADAEGGKWSGLDLTLDALRPGGVLVVDDMDPARYTDPAHVAAVGLVRDTLHTDPRLVTCELGAGSGIMIATRRRAALRSGG
ncbi:O-methyltransferase [Actinoplanes sp. NPDC049265]|uniref:O-methyltransferase n=1 Tax=Actinoplanes sp. NPDC049265 TaxID=3363902 RepID=UPI00371F04FB